ncbi:hypothetical protein AVEN_99572-1 [Araneus ventricosus]|uniref:Uncharacterized protein n=1 Tax=Araneus ventricosus TaxID=182803 RepID=A0A4Y2IBU2_ARAVE|nr:hypothetical protein AVEN_99572-1 [Araneus ventricosus]
MLQGYYSSKRPRISVLFVDVNAGMHFLDVDRYRHWVTPTNLNKKRLNKSGIKFRPVYKQSFRDNCPLHGELHQTDPQFVLWRVLAYRLLCGAMNDVFLCSRLNL